KEPPMPHPRIGRASEERVASKKNLEVLDDSPDRGHEVLSPEETASRQAEKQTLLQRLGFLRSAPVETTRVVEQEPVVVETAAVSPEDAAEVVGPLADRPTS